MNFSGLALRTRKKELTEVIERLRVSRDIIKVNVVTSHFHKHHNHLINVYSGIIDTLDEAIKQSESIDPQVKDDDDEQ